MECLYESELAQVWLGDGTQAVELVGGRSVDLVVMDPPYGVQYISAWSSQRFDMMRGDSALSMAQALTATAVTCLRSHRHIYAFGPDCLTELEHVSASTELVWDKTYLGMGNLRLPWGPAHERLGFGVVVFSEADRRIGRGRLAARLRRGSVLSVPRKNSVAVNKHPTEKPVALLRQLVETSSLPGELVLDPCCGSGSTLVAALITGRRCVGIEIERKYAEIAVARAQEAEKVAEELEAL